MRKIDLVPLAGTEEQLYILAKFRNLQNNQDDYDLVLPITIKIDFITSCPDITLSPTQNTPLSLSAEVG